MGYYSLIGLVVSLMARTRHRQSAIGNRQSAIGLIMPEQAVSRL